MLTLALRFRLYRDGLPVDLPRQELIALRFTMHNGLAVYTTWTTVAALINLDIAIIYVGGVRSMLETWCNYYAWPGNDGWSLEIRTALKVEISFYTMAHRNIIFLSS